MGFLGLGRSPLKHADPKKREQAVRDLPLAEQGQLVELALGDPDPGVRVAAAARVREPEFLGHLARHKDEAVAKIARERLANVAVEAIKGKKLAAAKPLLDAVREQSALVTISLQAEDPAVRTAAFDRLLALPDPSPKLLGTIAIQEPSGELGRRALPLIDKRQVLKDIAKKAKDAGLRAAAGERLVAKEAEARDKPKPEKRRRERLRRLGELVERAEAVAGEQDWQGGAAAFAELETAYRRVLADYAELDEDRACSDAQAAIARARGRWEAARTAALEAAQPATPVDAASDGERDESAPEPAAETPVAVRQPEPEALEPERQAKLDALMGEAARLAESSDWKDADYRFKELDKEWRVHFGELGMDDPRRVAFLDHYQQFKQRRREDRERRDAEYTQRIDHKRALLREAEELAAAEPDDGRLEAHAAALKDLQRRWREAGKLPAARASELNPAFRAACDRAYAPVKRLHEARDWERFANVPKAEALIERVRALLAQQPGEGVEAAAAGSSGADDAALAAEATPAAAPSADAETTSADTDASSEVPAASGDDAPMPSEADQRRLADLHQEVKGIQAEWKALGPLPRERKDELWREFRGICDRLYDHIRPLFAARDARREAASGAKEELIARLRQVLDEEVIGLSGSMADQDLQARKAETIKEMQAEWKALGPAPRAQEEQLWKRFKGLLDRFYAARREHFKVLDREREEALERKQALIGTARELAADAERFAAGQAVGKKDEAAFLNEVKDLQRRFREIGHVPREHYQQVRDDFKAACDRVYAVLEPWFERQDAERAGNLAAKQALIAELEELLEEERPDWFMDEVKAIQQKWKALGQVPRKDMAINDRFRELCDRIFDHARGG